MHFCQRTRLYGNNNHFLEQTDTIRTTSFLFAQKIFPISQGTGFKGGLCKVGLPLRRNGLWIYNSLCIAMGCGSDI